MKGGSCFVIFLFVALSAAMVGLAPAYLLGVRTTLVQDLTLTQARDFKVLLTIGSVLVLISAFALSQHRSWWKAVMYGACVAGALAFLIAGEFPGIPLWLSIATFLMVDKEPARPYTPSFRG